MVRWTDLRLMRRMVRDASFRAYEPRRTLEHWHYVRSSEMRNIIPYANTTDYIVNGALSYELPVMRRRLLGEFEQWAQEYEGDPLRVDAYTRALRVYKLLEAVAPIEPRTRKRSRRLRTCASLSAGSCLRVLDGAGRRPACCLLCPASRLDPFPVLGVFTLKKDRCWGSNLFDLCLLHVANAHLGEEGDDLATTLVQQPLHGRQAALAIDGVQWLQSSSSRGMTTSWPLGQGKHIAQQRQIEKGHVAGNDQGPGMADAFSPE